MKPLIAILAATIGAAGLGLVVFAGLPQQAAAVADPVNCTGYPEPRIFLENQSWWDPQPGPPEHPGTGQAGHIHVGMCFPLYQTISGDTLHLDVNIKLHNMPAIPSKVRLNAYGDSISWHNGVTVPPCPVADCEYNYSYDFPLSLLHYRGWREFSTYLNVGNVNGEIQRNWNRYFVFVDKALPDAPAGSAGSVLGNVGGDSWYSNVPGGTTGQYSRVNMVRGDVPWDEATGALTPVSGTWTPTVEYEATQNFAYVDPAFHATPPSKGTIVYEQTVQHGGYLTKQLSIDTTQLAEGKHRLVIGSGNVGANGTNTGVLVIPFVVDNNPCT